MIALFIDLTRITRYLTAGTRLPQELFNALILSVALSFAGAWAAKKFLKKLPRKHFRLLVGIFLALMGARLLILG